MQRVREYIYSLLLLMVIAVGGVSVSLQHIMHCHCSLHCTLYERGDSDEMSNHHHCSSTSVDCHNHRSRVDQHCKVVVSRDAADEFVVSSQLRAHSIVAIITLLYGVSREVIVEQSGGDYLDDWRNYNLYRGFDPACSLLRAPPALV